MFNAVPSSDAELVRSCLTDVPGAFSEIVARYQTLVCSVTYNSTGSLSRSEDLAQEVFVTAWKELRQLREPEKLRAWLCGIARRLTANTRRREGREPVCAAEELQDEHQSSGPGPAEQAISREEESILWRSLEQIPETYREPLILFYRENQSVERVAAALELTEDAAKQRLSRGRKLLQEQVALFVEGALRQSTPGRAFTLGVLAALPLMATSASAATIGAAAAKAGTAATGASALGIFSILLGPIVGCLGAWMGVQASLDNASSARERALILKQTKWMLALVLGFLVVMGFAVPLEARIWRDHTAAAITLGAAIPILYVAGLLTMILHFKRAQDRLHAQDAPLLTAEDAARHAAAWKTYEYKSKWTFLGLPLVHVRTGRPRGAPLRPAVGWIAIGDLSIGVIVSIGGIAFGGISIGGLSVGLLSTGGLALGALACGGLALGLWMATGGMAVGYPPEGGCAVAWHAAQGGMAVAHDFALGGSAFAQHANDATAREALASMAFFRIADALMRQPVLMNLVWLPMVLIVWQARRARAVRQRAT